MKPKRFARVLGGLALAVLLISLLPGPASGGALDVFKDPTDGAFDVSEWLLDRKGFLPVPIIVTEPAVGYGAGAALLFFHGKKEHGAASEAVSDAPLRLPPSISAVAAAYTENDSWVAAGGHFGSWKEDRIRYTGGVGKASLNLKFYIDDNPLDYNIEGVFLYQDIRFRIRDSNFFFGGDYIYFDSSSDFDLGPGIPGVKPGALDSTNAGLGLRAYWDGRDSIFTPGSGQEVDFKVSRFDEALGGDFDFWEAEAKLLSYHRLHPRLVLGMKLRGEATDGDVPFYALPFVQLRGVPAMRYQGERAGEVEAELRWVLNQRWSLIGFGGVGWTDSEPLILETEEDIVAGGFGFRYLVARRLGMHTGVDIAWGPEDTVVYIQVGGAW